MFSWSKSYISKATVFCIGYVQQYGYLFQWIYADTHSQRLVCDTANGNVQQMISLFFLSLVLSLSSIRMCGARYFSLFRLFFQRHLRSSHYITHLSSPVHLPIMPKISTTKLVQRNIRFGEILYLWLFLLVLWFSVVFKCFCLWSFRIDSIELAFFYFRFLYPFFSIFWLCLIFKNYVLSACNSLVFVDDATAGFVFFFLVLVLVLVGFLSVYSCSTQFHVKFILQCCM